MLPREHVWAEAVVCEAFGGVKKCVLGGFEVHEVGFCCGSITTCRGDFIGVVDCGSTGLLVRDCEVLSIGVRYSLRKRVLMPLSSTSSGSPRSW